MPVSLVEDSSLLAANIGTSTTRVNLFDVVEGQYRFIASGKAPSTVEAPYRDALLGVRWAIANLQSVTGRIFLDENKQLITPMKPDGSGIEAFTVTMSAGPVLRAVIVGLLSDVSLGSARRLAETSYLRVVETLGLNDHRKPDEQIDTILHARPDIIIMAGGTNGGASRSIENILESVGLACYLTPTDKRPAVLFAGNQSLTEAVKSSLNSLTASLHFSPNIHPTLDTEDLMPASHELAYVVNDVRKRQIPGVAELDTWSGGHIYPTAYAEGRMLRFLSKLSGAARGILSVDIGATASVVAAGFNGKLALGVYPQFGLGDGLPGLLQYARAEDILLWSHLDIAPSTVRDYLYQQTLYPGTIPATKEEQVIAYCVSRQALFLAIQEAKRNFPSEARFLRQDVLPIFEPILAGGGALCDTPSQGQSLLLLLDALQPIGITSIILDENKLLPILGAAADLNHLLPVQVLESGAFMSLGTVVSVISSVNYGTPVVRARLTHEDGSDARVEVKSGEIGILPLGVGQIARLTVQPVHRADIGNGPGRSAAVQVTGGVMGVVIDARGRPLVLPGDPGRRRELLKKWLWTLGGT
jgi:hypothetical protein